MVAFLNQFSSHLRAFLLTKFFSYAQEAFFKFLINIYFWRITNDISFLVLYNVLFEISHGLTYLSAGKVSKQKNRFLPLRAGLALQLGFLVCILLLKSSIVEYLVPVAILGGIAHGAYWSSDNVLKFDLTSPRTRLKFTAAHHILKHLAHSAIPLVASIIVIMHDNVISSYSEIFIAALIFTLLALLSTFFISKKNRLPARTYSPIKTGGKLLQDRNIRIVCTSTYLSYVADILPVLLGLMLFFASGSELSIGSYQFITVIAAVASNAVIGKYFSRSDYKKLLVYGGVLNFALIFILVLRQDFTAILIYGILSSIFSVANNPFYPLTQDSLNMYASGPEQLADIRVEFVTLTEVFVVAGKITGLLLLLLIHFNLSFTMLATTAIIFASARLLANISITRVVGEKELLVVDALE